MPYDAGHALEHAEVAGWALGTLDPDDAQTFEEHLRSCQDCQAAAAEFEPVVVGLKRAAPDVEPPDDLAAKTIAAVQHAVMAGKPTAIMTAKPAVIAPGQPEAQTAKASRWWHLHWSNPLLPLATAMVAAAVTAAAFLGVQAFQLTAPPVAAAFSLQAQPGFSGSARATARHTSGGWEIQLTVKHLAALHSGQFYECWYQGKDYRPGYPELISAGTFIVDRSGNGTFSMWSAADPAQFKRMEITAEKPDDAGQRGQVILEGIARA